MAGNRTAHAGPTGVTAVAAEQPLGTTLRGRYASICPPQTLIPAT
ncbi:hypothetical protein PflQ2_5467 [Pseudomonas fluorescens Q2-87]|uniref:Uncharacterized protein n=1 Tax=Pseudomonas fluorescens (strain Q2-87) TaxID=1038922 RepID=J2ENC0_PSEFQ|nr:hypothetical protein PflQ2_5467 [Pseudomonas fluorescens Q2-87]